MKNSVITSSSTKSTNTTTMEDRSETSCYFPGCRKDTNCNCEICLASINATLDLMPMSIQKSSINKLSASKSIGERTPISFNQSILSTPKSSVYQASVSPILKSTAKSIPLEKVVEKKNKKKNKKNRSWVFGFDIWRIFVGLCLIFAADSGFSWMISEFLKPTLSIEMMRNIGEQSWVCHDLNERLGFLKKMLQGEIVTGTVLSCNSSNDSIWKLNQEGLLLNSCCTLYKSMAEEVSIWGWPLQTAGLLTAGFSSLSLTVLSGRVTEWPEGMAGFTIRTAANNSSWLLGRMSASAVQLDPNTWVLEYKQSWILENSRLVFMTLEYLKFRIWRVIKELKQEFIVLPEFVQQFSVILTKDSFSHPT